MIENQNENEDIGDNENEGEEIVGMTMTDVIGEFLYKFKPKDIKELTEQFGKYQESKLKIDTEYKKQDLLLKEATLKVKAKIAVQHQWFRFILVTLSGIAVTYLITTKTFDSAAALFFGGLVAYLFGKEPK